MCYMSVVYRGGEAQCRAWSPNRHSCFPSAFICFTCGQRAFLLAIAYTNRIKYILIWRCRNCGKVNVLKLLASSYLSVSLPAGNILFPTGRIFMKMILFLKNLSKKIQVSVQSDRNNGYFTWRPIHNFYHISLSS